MEEHLPAGFSLKSKKTLVGLFGLLLLLITIPLGVYLAQQKQIFKPRAFEGDGGQSVIPEEPETSFTLGGSESVLKGLPFEISVLIKSDIDTANLFTAKLNFPSDLLEVSGITAPDAQSGVIKNWVEKTFDNSAGTLSLVGGVPPPGYQSEAGTKGGLMAKVTFTPKKVGTATISFLPGTAIYRNSDNANILGLTRPLTINITPEAPVVTGASSCQTSGLSLGAFTYSKLGQQKLVESVIADDGLTTYTRECNIGASGVDFADCRGIDKWERGKLSALPGGGNRFISYDAFTHTVNGQQKLIQSLLAENGTTTYTRDCSMTSEEVNWSGCGSWAAGSLSSSGIPAGSYQAYSAFAYTENGSPKLAQSFIAQDGLTAYKRTCDITPSGIDWPGCNGADKWTADSLSSLGLTAPSYRGTAAFTYTVNGATKLTQLLLGLDGNTTFQRVCDITPSGIDWPGCNGADKWVKGYLHTEGVPPPSPDLCSTPIPAPTITATPVPQVAGDVNGDGQVNLVDLSALLSRLGQTGAGAGNADLNHDGTVNSLDYSMLIKILQDKGLISY